MGLRDRIFSLVPGIKNTDFGKKIEINRCVDEYSRLLKERDNIDSQIDIIEEALGLKARTCRNLEEQCIEIDRLTVLQDELKSVYSKGKADPTQLSENELLTFQRIQELENLNKTKYTLTARILAIRQGLMNVSDPENSELNGNLNDRYMNPAEFIKHSSFVRIVDFFNACKRTGAIPLPDLTREDVTDLVISNGTSLHAKELASCSPILKTFLEELTRINERTGYNSGKYPLVPFNFEEGRLEGEIIISEVTQRETTEKTKND